MVEFIIRFIEATGTLFSRPLGWAFIMIFAIMAIGAYAELQHGRRRTNHKCKKIKEGLR